MSFGKACIRHKTVMTKYGRQTRCAQFGDVGDDGMGLGDPDRSAIAGPLIGGGIAQVATLGAKILGRGKPWGDKWGAAIGLGVSGVVSGILAFRQASRPTGISALITAGLVTLPRIAEDMLAPAAGATKGAFGVTTAEVDMSGAAMLGEDAVQLLDGGGGTGVLGVITAEQEMAGAGPSEVTLLGAARPEAELFGQAAFGANFFSNQ